MNVIRLIRVYYNLGSPVGLKILSKVKDSLNFFPRGADTRVSIMSYIVVRTYVETD